MKEFYRSHCNCAACYTYESTKGTITTTKGPLGACSTGLLSLCPDKVVIMGKICRYQDLFITHHIFTHPDILFLGHKNNISPLTEGFIIRSWHFCGLSRASNSCFVRFECVPSYCNLSIFSVTSLRNRSILALV